MKTYSCRYDLRIFNLYVPVPQTRTRLKITLSRKDTPITVDHIVLITRIRFINPPSLKNPTRAHRIQINQPDHTDTSGDRPVALGFRCCDDVLLRTGRIP